MLALELLAERKIAEAIARGELSNLPGEGSRLEFDDDPLIPEELRVAYRILKSAGYVPPEVEVLRAIADLERLIEHTADTEQRRIAALKLDMLRLRIDRSHPGRSSRHAHEQYRDKMLSRLGA